MPEPSHATFDADVARALRAVGARVSERALDPLGDPAGAAAVLNVQHKAPLLLRAAPALDRSERAHGGAYAPEPRDPLWLRFDRGSHAVTIAPLRLAASARPRDRTGGVGESRDGEPELRDATRVVVTADRRACCDAPSCARERWYAAGWVVLAGESRRDRRLLVAEAHDLDPARAEGVVEAVAAPLARALGVPLETSRGLERPDEIAARSFPDPAPLPAPVILADALARFSIRSEGELIVLRDHLSAGPRASAARNGAIGAALLVVGMALWVLTIWSAARGESGLSVGVGSAAALLSITAYAFLGVARFSARYAGRSAPVMWLARDRFVVLPWVSRTGAVDVRPEGRLGAAIPVGEIREVEVRERSGRFAIELETDHGAIEALVTESEGVARYWRDVLMRAAASMRHPGGPSAKQRLRRSRAERSAETGVTGA